MASMDIKTEKKKAGIRQRGRLETGKPRKAGRGFYRRVKRATKAKVLRILRDDDK